MIYKTKKFNDGQVTAIVEGSGNLEVVVKGNSYEDLFLAASIKEAWSEKNKLNKTLTASLTILCLIGQRSDRRFNEGESFDLKVIANFINSMNYDEVKIFHPHSDTSIALINKASKISHFTYVEKVYQELGNPVLVSPDAGAYKATFDIAKKLGASLVPSNKVRVNGEPLISIQGDVNAKECLIVDDLADGGRTFKFLAKALKDQGAKKVFLYVSHGQFNYGFKELKEYIDHVYCTNSFRDIEDNYVTQFKIS